MTPTDPRTTRGIRATRFAVALMSLLTVGGVTVAGAQKLQVIELRHRLAEQVLPALALMVVVLPLSVLGTGFAWHALPGRIRDALPSGIEALVFSLTLGAAIAACLAMSRPIEALVFGGSAQTWLFDAMGLRYDQRNAIVVGLAMGFAVVPIIFAIAEDAFSNVPPSQIQPLFSATRPRSLNRTS